jgi:hypothetical protein
VISYTVPVIVLKRSTPKEAVCTVFEKVNTGGVPLNVFELLTATFAADKVHRDFRLNDDWRARHERLTAKPVLRSVENTDFLQAVTLLASQDRRAEHLHAGGDPAQAPGITCKRCDILRLTLTEYLRHAPRVESALLWAAGFLAQQHIFRADDLPYRTQLVPLAAIKALLGQAGESQNPQQHSSRRTTSRPTPKPTPSPQPRRLPRPARLAGRARRPRRLPWAANAWCTLPDDGAARLRFRAGRPRRAERRGKPGTVVSHRDGGRIPARQA